MNRASRLLGLALSSALLGPFVQASSFAEEGRNFHSPATNHSIDSFNPTLALLGSDIYEPDAFTTVSDLTAAGPVPSRRRPQLPYPPSDIDFSEISLRDLLEQLQEAQRTDNRILEASTLNQIAFLYAHNENYRAALNFHLKALEIYDSIANISENQAQRTTIYIFWVYIILERYEDAYSLLLGILESFDTASIRSLVRYSENIFFSNPYSDANRGIISWKSAAGRLRLIALVESEIGDFQNSVSPIDLGLALYNSGECSAVLSVLEDGLSTDFSDISLRELLEQLQEARNAGEKLREASILNQAACLYAYNENYDMALSFHLKAIEIYTSTPSISEDHISDIIDTYIYAFQIHMILGQYEDIYLFLSTIHNAYNEVFEFLHSNRQGFSVLSDPYVGTNRGIISWEESVLRLRIIALVEGRVHGYVNFDTLIHLGWSLYNLGDYSAALSTLESALSEHKNTSCQVCGLTDIGRIYTGLGQFELALSTFQTALHKMGSTCNLNDDDCSLSSQDILEVRLFGYIGAVYTELEDFNRAIHFLEESLKYQDSHTLGERLNDLGFAYYKIGNYEKSEEIYRLSLEESCGCQHGLSMIGLGDIRLLEGDLDTALDFYTNALQVTRNSAHNEGVALSLIK